VVGWSLAGGAVARDLAVSPNQTRGLDLLGSCDLNGDGSPDLVMRNTSGVVLALPLYPSGGVLTDLGGRTGVKGSMPAPARLAGTGDFNGDGRCDLLWRRGDGQLELWFGGEGGNSARVSHDNVVNAPSPTPLSWQVVGVGDFNGDGTSDIALTDEGGQVVLWYMDHGLRIGEQLAGPPDTDHQWVPQAVGDFDGDQHADLLWRNAGGQLAVWFRGLFDNAHTTPTYLNQGFDTGLTWHVQGVLDTNADGLDDIVWRSDSGAAGVWTMNGGVYVGGTGTMAAPAVRTDAASYAQGQPIRISWSGLTSSATNWVAYAPEGSAPTSVMRWSYTGGATAGSLLFEGWLTPGRYVARTFIDDSYTTTSQSAAFVIH
jgi:FG-GAP-like repeat